LAIAHLERCGFTPDQFAEFHPGGSLGRKSFLRVRDLALTGDAVPLVPCGTPLSQAIDVISLGGLGCVLTKNDSTTELGIFTDGDLRRLIASKVELADKTIGDVALAKPKSIESRELASTALRVMEENRITVLVITEEGRLTGLLHLHHLLRAGLG
jgi:arabinose-5-phosphate isomerase